MALMSFGAYTRLASLDDSIDEVRSEEYVVRLLSKELFRLIEGVESGDKGAQAI